MFVGIGVDHITELLPYISRKVRSLRPTFITLELPLNTNTYPTFPWFRDFDDDKDYEWAQYAHLAVEEGISYFCIDGTTDEETYPWFTDVALAASVILPETRGSRYSHRVEFFDKTLQILGGRTIVDLERMTDEEKEREYPLRDAFAAKVINKIAQDYNPVRSLLHIGGMYHFQHKRIPNTNRYSPALQELIDAKKKIIYDAIRKRVSYRA